MSLKAVEMRALQQAQDTQEICLWRASEPIYQPGREYSAGLAGRMTVTRVRELHAVDIALRDIKRSGYVNYGNLTEELRATGGWGGGLLWEVRVLAGDRTDRPRLLAPSGRRSGDYTSVPGRAMRDEPEAVSATDLARLSMQTQADRDRLVTEWRARIAEEARILFPGRNSLRNLERVLNSLTSEPKPGAKRRKS